MRRSHWRFDLPIQTDFNRYKQTYGIDARGVSTFGWLAVTMPGYAQKDEDGGLFQLKCNALSQDAGMRPVIEFGATDHPLYFDQRDDISRERAAGLAVMVMHPARN